MRSSMFLRNAAVLCVSHARNWRLGTKHADWATYRFSCMLNATCCGQVYTESTCLCTSLSRKNSQLTSRDLALAKCCNGCCLSRWPELPTQRSRSKTSSSSTDSSSARRKNCFRKSGFNWLSFKESICTDTQEHFKVDTWNASESFPHHCMRRMTYLWATTVFSGTLACMPRDLQPALGDESQAADRQSRFRGQYRPGSIEDMCYWAAQL